MNHPDKLTNSEQQPSTEQQMVDGETTLLAAILESLGNLEANVDLSAQEVLVQDSNKLVWFPAIAPQW